MKNKTKTKTKTNELSLKNSIVKGVRWPLPVYAALEQAAKKEGKDVSTIIREYTTTQIMNKFEHEDFIGSLKPEDPKEIQKNFFDVLNKSNDVLLNTISNMYETLLKKMKTQDKLIREAMYLLLYLNHEVPDEDKDARQISANKRLKIFLQVFDKENS